VKVCDFGIAALGKAPKDGGGQAAGTPEYMAPEQQMGGAVTAAADVYACGVVLYEMLAGEVPFTDAQAYRILLKHQNEAPRPPSALTPGLSPALEAIVLRCLEKKPGARYQSARELRAELRRVLSTMPSADNRPT
jgi:serine/threonine-protein kinase